MSNSALGGLGALAPAGLSLRGRNWQQKSVWALVAAVLFSLGLLGPALADAPMGTAVAVRQDASLVGAKQVTLLQGSDLFEGQTIKTGPVGEVQVIFADDTHLVVGPNSALIIEKYLMRADGTAGKFAVNALAGTFRFLTGNSEKSAYQIITPTGTLGVRGTKFDFTVDPRTGQTKVVLFEGQVFLCARSKDCVTISERCSVGAVNTPRDAELFDRKSEKREIANADFRYVESQQSLKTEFRVRKPSECGGGAVIAEHDVAENGVIPVVEAPAAPPPPPPPPVCEDDDEHDGGPHGHESDGDPDSPGHGEHGNGMGNGHGRH
jgi:hypothetical protein